MKIFGIRKRFYVPAILIFLSLFLITSISSNGEIHFVYGVCPVFVFYNDSFLDEDQGGVAKGLLVFIKQEYRDCNIVLQHELIHARQSYRTYFLDWILVYLSDSHFAKREAEAYALELTNEDQIGGMARFIKEEYNLNVSNEKIEKYLKNYYKP